MTHRSPTFDPAPFLRALEGDRASFVEYGRQFLAIYPDSLAALHAAAAAGDATALRDQAHALRRSLALFHADDVMSALESIEHACRSEPSKVGTCLIDSLAGLASLFREEFDEYCAWMACDDGRGNGAPEVARIVPLAEPW